MMNFNDMKMTHQQITEDRYRFKIGNDIIEVTTNFRCMQYFDDMYMEGIVHYIKNPNIKPTNPNRTTVLMSRVYDYFRELYLKEIENDLRKIAFFQKSIDFRLKTDYEGIRLHFCKGFTTHDIFQSILQYYTSTCAGGDIYPILIDLSQKNDGFLFREIKDYLTI